MILLIDIGNTNTHLGFATPRRLVRQADVPTDAWFSGRMRTAVRRFVGRDALRGAAVCSVVPRATPRARATVRQLWNVNALELTPKTLRGIGIDYPRPNTIGPDRLANAVAARHSF